jgi:predicted amidohydrolase YtcJ
MWDNARTVFVNPNLPVPDLAIQAAACVRLARDLNALGVTTAYEASYRRAIDAAAWRRAMAGAPATLRVVLGPYPLHGDHWDERSLAGTVAASGLSTGFGDEWLQLGSLQLGIDGGLLGRTAALLAPYADDPAGARRGSFRVSEETLAAAIRRAFDADWQVGLICQGDGGIERALSALATARAAEPGRDRHARLEHAYLWSPALMDRAAELGVTWNTQPGILAVAGPAATLGAWGDRARWAFPFRSLLERGVPISSGSDWGVGPLDPMAALDALVTHRFGPGDGDVALNPDETLTVAQALRAMTLGSAKAGLFEDQLGSLDPGKRADLAILSADLTSIAPGGIRSVRVDETWLDGRPVWRREPSETRPA